MGKNGFMKDPPLFYVNGAGVKTESIDSIGWRADPGQVGGYTYTLLLLFYSGKEMGLPDSPDARRLFKAVTGKDFDPEKVLIVGAGNANS